MFGRFGFTQPDDLVVRGYALEVLLGYLAQARDIADEHGHVLVGWDVLSF